MGMMQQEEVMEALEQQESQGMTRRALRIWAFVFVCLGILSRSVLQNGILHIQTVSPEELLEQMSASRLTMILTTAALVLQAVETCAIPIFLFLLVEGVGHTGNVGKYFLRVLGLAFLSEIPYNLAMSGKLWEPATRNPVFAMAVSLALFYFLKRYQGASPLHLVVKLFVFTAAMLWVGFLGVEYGPAILVLAVVLWLLRLHAKFRILGGAATAAVCSLFSPYFMASAMSFLILHFYNGQKGKENRLAGYLTYPILLLVGALATYLFL
jgi:hypothetical protein